MKTCKLRELLLKVDSGVWGAENNENGINILRLQAGETFTERKSTLASKLVIQSHFYVIDGHLQLNSWLRDQNYLIRVADLQKFRIAKF